MQLRLLRNLDLETKGRVGIQNQQCVGLERDRALTTDQEEVCKGGLHAEGVVQEPGGSEVQGTTQCRKTQTPQ